MKKICLSMLMLCLVLAASVTGAWSYSSGAPKLVPESVAFPMIRADLYRNVAPDIYAHNFGVLRMFRTSVVRDFGMTLVESKKWADTWASYGVLGKGESVFTWRGARFRSRHQGRR